MTRTTTRTVLLALSVAGCRSPEGSGPATQPMAVAEKTAAPSAMAGPIASDASPDGAKGWGFDTDKAGEPPAGLSFGRTGSGHAGRWIVQAAADAPSQPNVLVQLDADPTDARFPVAILDGSSFKDVRLSVSCKCISGSVDQACGLVWRFVDEKNYYLTRANALEGNVRLYHVKDGNRVQLASWSGKVATKTWHKLAVEAKGDRFVVSFDGQSVLDARDSTFTAAGKVGVWTKADSVTQFDDLSASVP